jgi:hypothetical protein
MSNDKDRELRKHLGYAKALMDAMELSIHGQEQDVWRFSSYLEYMEKYNDLLTSINAESYTLDVSGLTYFVVGKIPRSTDTTAMQQKQYFDSVYTNLAILRSYIENALDLKRDETLSLKDFFQANLRKAVIGIPKNEIDIQNAVEILLIGRGLAKGTQYDREAGPVKVSLKKAVPDFVIYRLNMALEVKFSRDKASSKRIVDEINADIRAYSKKYARQLYIVYDMGSISNEDEFKNDLDNAEDVSVIVVKH